MVLVTFDTSSRILSTVASIASTSFDYSAFSQLGATIAYAAKLVVTFDTAGILSTVASTAPAFSQLDTTAATSFDKFWF